jgi:arylsulfatase A
MFDVLPTFAALAGGQVPTDCKIDGANIWPHLTGETGAKPAHETFYFYRGLKLEAVRNGPWKLHLAHGALYNLSTGIGEASGVAAANPAIVTLH